MADPLSVTASAASVVSLADILLRTGKEVYTFFRAVKNASKDVQSIIFELQQYEGTLMSIKKYVDSFNNSLFATNDRLSASGLLTNLQHCEAEFRVLKDIVEDSRRKRELGSIHKFASKVKWVFDEKKIAQCCQKLENVKSLLNTELSLAGRKDIRQSDIVIRGQLKSNQDGIQAVRTVSGNQHQGIIDQIQHSTTETHEMLSIEFTGLHGASQTIQNDTTTLKRKFEESREAVTSNTEVIRRDISQASSSVLKVVQTGMKQCAKRQRGLARQHADSIIQLQEKIDQLPGRLSHYITAEPQVQTVSPANVTITSTENLDVIVMPLMLMQLNLPKAFSMLESGGQAFLSREAVEFLQSEIKEIQAAAHDASSIALRRAEYPGKGGNSASLGQSGSNDFRRPPVSYELCARPHSEKEFHRKAGWKQFVHWTYAGMLSIGIRKEFGTLSSATSASVTFMPEPELSKLGVSILWINEIKAAINPPISRCIRTFRILDNYSHPVYTAAGTNDVLELQRMLSAKEISPWDRNENHHNLVQISISRGAYNTTELLLEEGATAHDSHWGEHNALWDVWIDYGDVRVRSQPENEQYPPPKNLEFWINMSDLVIRHGASAEECVNLIPENGNLLFLPAEYTDIILPDLKTLCKYLIRIGSDIEARNEETQTPALYAAYSHWDSAVDWLPTLLENGADLTAQDAEGRAGFHQMFLGYKEMMEWGCLSESPYYYKDFKAKANILLDAGCNPFKPDLEGHTPSCYAWDNEILGLWENILGEWIAGGRISASYTCPCGGVYELADMWEQSSDESEGSGYLSGEEENSETEGTERYSQGVGLEEIVEMAEDDGKEEEEEPEP